MPHHPCATWCGTHRARGQPEHYGRSLMWHLHQHRRWVSAHLHSAGSMQCTRGLLAACSALGVHWLWCEARGGLLAVVWSTRRECQQCGALRGAANSSVKPQQPPHHLAAVPVPRRNTLHPARRCRLRCLHSMTHRTWPVLPLLSGRLRPQPRGLTSAPPALPGAPSHSQAGGPHP